MKKPQSFAFWLSGYREESSERGALARALWECRLTFPQLRTRAGNLKNLMRHGADGRAVRAFECAWQDYSEYKAACAAERASRNEN